MSQHIRIRTTHMNEHWKHNSIPNITELMKKFSIFFFITYFFIQINNTNSMCIQYYHPLTLFAFLYPTKHLFNADLLTHYFQTDGSTIIPKDCQEALKEV